MLRAVLFAFAAADAIGSGSRCLSGSGAHEVFLPTGESIFGVNMVICGKGAGNVHMLGAGHAVAAAGAANFHFGIDGSHNFLQHGLFGRAQIADFRRRCCSHVLLNHFQRVHTGKDTGDFLLIP